MASSQYIAILISLIVLLAGAGAQKVVERRVEQVVVENNQSSKCVNETVLREIVEDAIENASTGCNCTLNETIIASELAAKLGSLLTGSSCNYTLIGEIVGEAAEEAVSRVNVSVNITQPPVNLTCNCSRRPDVVAYGYPENATIRVFISGEHSVRMAYMLLPNTTMIRLSVAGQQQLGPVTVATLRVPPTFGGQTVVNPGPGAAQPLLVLVLENQTLIQPILEEQGGGGGGGQY